MVKTPNKPNQKTQIQLLEQGDLFRAEQPSGSNVQEIENVSNVTAKAPMKEQGDLFPVVCQCLVKVQIKTKTQTKT